MIEYVLDDTTISISIQDDSVDVIVSELIDIELEDGIEIVFNDIEITVEVVS